MNKHNQLQNWQNIFKALANRRLPFTNIAYKLFLDAEFWFSKDNSCPVRYDDTVKRFWKTGKQLFKGKFIRFMSGLKNKVQLGVSANGMGELNTSMSSVTFIVPSKEILGKSDEVLKTNC